MIGQGYVDPVYLKIGERYEKVKIFYQFPVCVICKRCYSFTATILQITDLFRGKISHFFKDRIVLRVFRQPGYFTIDYTSFRCEWIGENGQGEQ